MNKPRSKTTAEARKDKVEKALSTLGDKVYQDLDSGIFPSVTFASRSVRNIVYDRKLEQFILGSAQVKRAAGNIKHIRPFTQLLWLAYFSNKLVHEKRTSTLRDVYYSAQAFDVEFMDQAESDELITDLEVLLESAREEFNVFPEERSAIFGNLTVEYTVRGYEGKTLDLSSHPDGMMIGPALTTAEFKDTDAEHRDRHREGRPLHQIHRGEGPREVQGDIGQHGRAAPAFHPLHPEEVARGTQASHRHTVRRGPLGSAHRHGDQERVRPKRRAYCHPATRAVESL